MPDHPLDIAGYEIDPVTGQPQAEIRKGEAEARYKRIIEDSQNLIVELSGNGGELVRTVMQNYVDRIHQLMADDVECNIYERILRDVKRKVDIGQRLVEQKTEGLFR